MDQSRRQLHITSYLGGQNPFATSSSIASTKLPLGNVPQRQTYDTQHGYPISQPSPLLSHGGRPAQPSGLRYSTTLDPNIAVDIDPKVPLTSVVPSQKIDHQLKEKRPFSRHHGMGRPPTNLSDQTHPMISPSKKFGSPPKSVDSHFDSSDNAPKRKLGRPRVHPLPESKPKGRPRKADPKHVTPKFIPFLCEWKDCKAELHNLDTLRKHVYSVHSKLLPSGGISCLWGKCGAHREIQDKETGASKISREYYEFQGMEKFKTHTEKVHLIPFAWHMGDGPRSSTLDGSESERSSYLSDASGRQVTPSVASQPVKSGSARVNNARRLAHQKCIIDPSLESLVTFATPALKAGFYMPDPGTRQRVAAPAREPVPDSS